MKKDEKKGRDLSEGSLPSFEEVAEMLGTN